LEGKSLKTKLDKNGYVTKYFYSGPKATQFSDSHRESDQLKYEKYLRGIIAKHEDLTPPESIKLGSESTIGLPWKYYYSHGNVFMDASSFFVEPRRIDMLAATVLEAEEDMEAGAYLWSCCAVDLWVDGKLCGGIKTPVYKPISREKLILSLKKGKNLIFVRLETLGVRDTRISFALQVLENQDKILVSLPDEEGAAPYAEAEEILNSAKLAGWEIIFSEKLPQKSAVIYDTEQFDFYKRKERFIRTDVSGLSKVVLKDDYASFFVEIPVGDGFLKRRFERIELKKSKYLPANGDRRKIFEKIAEITSIYREETDGFALYPMLARYFLGQASKRDEEELKITLSQIGRRMDCADFMTCALIRFLKNYPVSEEIKAEVKKAMLNFRYWMDEDGQDGMCFWSENHSLMFYQTAYFFGQEYPDDIFVRSGKTGREMHEHARECIREWLLDVCETGYDEFNSGVYTPITFAALLNIVDYAETELSLMAQKAADLMLRTAALHCFKNVIISPQGRIYRDVLFPHLQALQSIVHYVVPDAPYVYSEWLISLATSKYKIPEDFKDLMDKKGAFSYNSSNAVIDLYKTEDYILTSVQSPRRDGKIRTWEHDMGKTAEGRHIYTKSLNECFHGTMQFEPGVLGYQQHLWYAALDPELVVFANHPGGTCEDMPEVRPGYWYGNGITPALRQEKNVLGAIYAIPDTFPIKFTHLFWNEKKFDKTLQKDGWLFGKKGNGYIGIWCSGEMQDYDDVLFGCEKRVYANKAAYLCVCGSESENGSFELFVSKCLDKNVIFDQNENRLSCEEFSLIFINNDNKTQYVK
jgi:hypothetical protein